MATSRAQSVELDAEVHTPVRSDDESSHAESSDVEEEQQVEWLATTRTKRATAGNRLSSLIQQAAVEDDELELLFAEDEDDAGFEDAEDDASDVQMDSSDDDDDQGPTADAEELEGEKELQQQVRADRQSQKRKANDGIPRAFRKKVKIDPTAPTKATPPKSKKKADRMSWIPSAKDLPTRASARSTTKISKAQLHAQMLDREKKRLRQLEILEQTQKKKEAAKPKAMTQEDRLTEAARVEEQNAKSLNTWEEAERKREEEQRAKLEALHNRKLQGPYLTWWSGMAEWIDGKLKRVGKNFVVEEKQKGTAGRKRKAEEMMEDFSSSTKEPPPTDPPVTSKTASEDPTLPQATGEIPPNGLDASLEIPAAQEESAPMKSDVAQKHDDFSASPIAAQAGQASAEPAPAVILDGSTPLPGFMRHPQRTPIDQQIATPQPPRMIPSQTAPFEFTPVQYLPHVALPPVTERGTWNCLILENFNETSIKSKDVQCQVLFNRKFHKSQKGGHPVLCAITAFPAKFRDPSTNLPYCNTYAYKEIQKLKRGEYKWSTLLQAYVGQTQYAARGVPLRFLKSVPIASDPRAGPAQSVN